MPSVLSQFLLIPSVFSNTHVVYNEQPLERCAIVSELDSN